MRVILLLAALAAVAAGQERRDAQSLNQTLAALPSCGMICMAPVLVSYSCTLTTTEALASCLCPSVEALHTISDCVLTTCTYDDQHTIAAAQKKLCVDFPIPSRSREVQMAGVILFLVAGACVLLRCFSRITIAKQFWWDDYCIVACSVLLTLILGIIMWDTSIGFGKHIWNVEPENVQLLLRLIWILMLLYIVVQVLTKVSILLFYLRVFPNRWMRISVHVLNIWLIVHGTGFFLAVAFECTPVALIWDKGLDGTCINQNAVTFVGAIFSIVEDIIIFILPMPLVFKLQLGRGRRVSLIVMFGLGSFACVASMIRLKVLGSFGFTLDSTWDNVDITIWSMIELAMAVICVCLPSTKPLLSRFLPRIFGSENNTNASNRVTESATWSSRNRKNMQSIPDNNDGSSTATDRTRNEAKPSARSIESEEEAGPNRTWHEEGSDTELVVLENGRVVQTRKGSTITTKVIIK